MAEENTIEGPEDGECSSGEYPEGTEVKLDPERRANKRKRSNSSEEGECSSSEEEPQLEDCKNKAPKCSSSEEELQLEDKNRKNKTLYLFPTQRQQLAMKRRHKKAKNRRKREKEKQKLLEQTVSYTVEKNQLNQFYNLTTLLTSPKQHIRLVNDIIRNKHNTQKFVFTIRDLQNIIIQLLRLRVSRDVLDVNCHSLSSVVVIWMAHVSPELVKEHWPAFQVTFPSESTKLFHFMNPGSDRFVRPGYEAILLIQDQQNTVKKFKHAPTPGRVTCSYLLTEEEMYVNSFPSLQTHPNYEAIEQVPFNELTDDTVIILALDCEFCDTASGRALTRISLVNQQLECVYDSFVIPDEEITDYKTQYSGITKQKLAGVTTSIQDVYSQIRNIITDRTILLGHSLENDLQVMKLCVSHIIDTTFLFTPTSTPTFKPSLRFLAKEVLNKTIQTSPCGHDSIEDAKVCMELLLAKLQQGPEYSISWHEDKRSIVDYMGYCGVNSLLVDHQALLGKHVKTKNVKCSFAIGDDNIVSNTIEGLNTKSYDFIWLQMHDFHTFCKKEYEEGKEVSSGEVRKLLASMLQLVEVLFNRASPGTMFIVCAGSGNLQRIKQFNAKRDQNMEELKVLVDKARKGVAFFKFKPHQDSTTNPEY